MLTPTPCTCLVVTGYLVKYEEDVSEEVVIGGGQAVHKAVGRVDIRLIEWTGPLGKDEKNGKCLPVYLLILSILWSAW